MLCHMMRMAKNIHTPITSDIRKRALDARISIRELQRRAGVANNIIYLWETRGGTPAPLTLAKIYDVLEKLEAERG